MSTAAAGAEHGSLIGADELEEQQACQQFALSSDQLVGLHARRLGWYDSRKLGVSYECARLYKVRQLTRDRPRVVLKGSLLPDACHCADYRRGGFVKAAHTTEEERQPETHFHCYYCHRGGVV